MLHFLNAKIHLYLVANLMCFFLAGGESVHFKNSTLHRDVAVEEFGNIASEPQHLYDNINELYKCSQKAYHSWYWEH